MTNQYKRRAISTRFESVTGNIGKQSLTRKGKKKHTKKHTWVKAVFQKESGKRLFNNP
jgi:hypothetical protein